MSNRTGREELKASEPRSEAGRLAYEDRGKD